MNQADFTGFFVENQYSIKVNNKPCMLFKIYITKKSLFTKKCLILKPISTGFYLYEKYNYCIIIDF